MNRAEVFELVQKYNQGQCTAEERSLLESWYISQQELHHTELSEAQIAQELAAIYQALPQPARQVKLWPRIAAVAAAVAVIVFGLWFFNYKGQVASIPRNELAVNDIAPGKQGATLTLANGKKIRLSDAANGEIAKEAGITVSKTADGQLVYEIKDQVQDGDRSVELTNVLSTAKGETYAIILPDQTKVWLNAASSLTYNANLLEHGLRKVKLAGEAYFQVAKDKAHPFIVITGQQEVEVLGTHFNINAYEDEPNTKTTLLEGSVKVSSSKGSSQTLQPDQQAILSQSGIEVIPVVAEAYIDWKEGSINFRREGLQSIMRKVARWYNVEVEYQGVSGEDQTFTGYVTRTENVSIVLDALSKISDLKFKIVGKKIIVSK